MSLLTISCTICIYSFIYDIVCDVLGLRAGKGIPTIIVSWIDETGEPGPGNGSGSMQLYPKHSSMAHHKESGPVDFEVQDSVAWG